MKRFTQEQIDSIREIVRQELKKHDEEDEEGLFKSLGKELQQWLETE
jgi:predicted Zn-dependent peptidase